MPNVLSLPSVFAYWQLANTAFRSDAERDGGLLVYNRHSRRAQSLDETDCRQARLRGALDRSVSRSSRVLCFPFGGDLRALERAGKTGRGPRRWPSKGQLTVFAMLASTASVANFELPWLPPFGAA